MSHFLDFAAATDLSGVNTSQVLSSFFQCEAEGRQLRGGSLLCYANLKQINHRCNSSVSLVWYGSWQNQHGWTGPDRAVCQSDSSPFLPYVHEGRSSVRSFVLFSFIPSAQSGTRGRLSELAEATQISNKSHNRCAVLIKWHAGVYSDWTWGFVKSLSKKF